MGLTNPHRLVDHGFQNSIEFKVQKLQNLKFQYFRTYRYYYNATIVKMLHSLQCLLLLIAVIQFLQFANCINEQSINCPSKYARETQSTNECICMSRNCQGPKCQSGQGLICIQTFINLCTFKFYTLFTI